MNASFPSLSASLVAAVRSGLVIPAHPLALTAERRLDERRQRALTRYYLDSGVRGLAVGVHTTQFAIRQPQVGLLRPVLELAMQTAREYQSRPGVVTDADASAPYTQTVALEPQQTSLSCPALMIAGICGPTGQAVGEAELARNLGYHAGLLSLGGLNDWSEADLLQHARRVAEVIPLFGFYLQPAVGGRLLSYDYWREFAEIPNVVAIKLAPFNRYQTLDVVRGVADSSRWDQVALYTGNDDAIVVDLLSRYQLPVDGELRQLQIVGGLLGHWACWTRSAVELHQRCRQVVEGAQAQESVTEWMVTAHQVTDMNAAIFDAANRFQGCIAGIHQVLCQQGLLAGTWCFDPRETLGPGQAEQIARVRAAYPHLQDDDFVRANLSRWLDD